MDEEWWKNCSNSRSDRPGECEERLGPTREEAFLALQTDMQTARSNAQWLKAKADRLTEQAQYWTSVHERLSAVISLYTNIKKAVGDIEKLPNS